MDLVTKIGLTQYVFVGDLATDQRFLKSSDEL